MPFLKKYIRLWNEWEIRLCVICSLLLQIFLILFASFRRRQSKTAKLIRFSTWLAYLLADTVATFSLGQLSNAITTPNSKSTKDRTYSDKYNDLVAFWAPFLLLHLGGPDTITALALEDNELWLRHLLYLGVHLFAVGYVFVQSLPNNTLRFPTLLLLLAGTIKYLERTMALYLASNDGLRRSIPKAPDQGRNYAILLDECILNSEAGLASSIEIPLEYTYKKELVTDEEDRDAPIVVIAYEFFTTFKRIFIDLLISFKERDHSRNFFLQKSAIDAFKIIEIQLGLAYDIHYTKAAVVHGPAGYASHTICFFSILAAFFLFLHFHPHNIQQEDMFVTYALIVSALILEIVALMNIIFSPWTFVLLKKNDSRLRSLVGKFLVRHPSSISMSQYSLINCCVWDNWTSKFLRKMSRHWVTNRLLDEFILVSDGRVTPDLIEFIFGELKRKSMPERELETLHLGSSRGSYALKERACYRKFGWTVDVEFEESILLWHIATDLCFYLDPGDRETTTENPVQPPIALCTRRQVSKLISDYMLYLLVFHPSMISSEEGIRQIKYKEAYEEVIGLIPQDCYSNESAGKKLGRLSFVISKLKVARKPVFFNACILFNSLNEETSSGKWEIISEVWAELLSYAASHSRGKYHVECLVQGGELLTYVWYFMAHMGLAQRYHNAPSDAGAYLMVQK